MASSCKGPEPVPPVGDDAAPPAPEGAQSAAGAAVGGDQHAEPQSDPLPAGRQPVEIGGHARGTDRRDADAVFAHLLGESHRPGKGIQSE